MLDRSLIGRTSEPGVNEVEKGALRRFAEALGMQSASLVAPPTFPATFRAGSDLLEGLLPGGHQVLHGEQAFEYERSIVAGDVITVTERIADVYERSGPGGRMHCLVVEGDGVDADGEPVYRSRQVLIVRS